MPTRSVYAAKIICLLFSFSLLTACGARHYPEGECIGANCADEGGVAGSTMCSTDVDCGLGQFCNGGICQDGAAPAPGSSGNNQPTTCESTADCSFGLFCDLTSNTCVECLSEDHCDLGFECVEGSCRDSSLCFEDTDCAGDLVCEIGSGACVECTADTHCPSGSVCSNNSCVASGGGNPGGPECSTQADCDPYGWICNMSSSTCEPCSIDDQCGAGRVCNAGICVNDTSSNGGGGSNAECTLTSDCNGLACISGSCTACAFDFECWDTTNATLLCDSGSCVQPECSTAYDCPATQGCWAGRCGSCLYDSECRSGEVCSDGACSQPTTPECTVNSDCATGQVCVGGSCGACTDSSQCDSGRTCQSGSCVETTNPGTGGTGDDLLGQSCTGIHDCGAGQTCLNINNEQFCTRTCIGSGQGGSADCPDAFACYNFDQGGLDGVSICIPSAVMPSTLDDGSTFPGQPFDLQPGDSCTTANSGCQTMYCLSETECMRSCQANRDCGTGEICYGAWVPTDTTGTTYELIDAHYCTPSNSANFLVAGQSCSSGLECDSGMCTGTCSNDSTKMCNSSTDCSGGTCSGTCTDHCRSNSDCSAGQVCDGWPTDAVNNTGWVPVCQPKLGGGMIADGVACTANSDCNSDWCVNNTCTTMCALDTDCTGSLAGKTCQMTQLQDASNNPIYTAQFCMD